ncbi:hypothetical protein PCK1_000596, partial [Pneumocystis canis]
MTTQKPNEPKKRELSKRSSESSKTSTKNPWNKKDDSKVISSTLKNDEKQFKKTASKKSSQNPKNNQDNKELNINKKSTNPKKIKDTNSSDNDDLNRDDTFKDNKSSNNNESSVNTCSLHTISCSNNESDSDSNDSNTGINDNSTADSTSGADNNSTNNTNKNVKAFVKNNLLEEKQKGKNLKKISKNENISKKNKFTSKTKTFTSVDNEQQKESSESSPIEPANELSTNKEVKHKDIKDHSKKRKEISTEIDKKEIKKSKTNTGENAEGSTTIFVGGLSWNVDDDWLAREFENIGTVVSSRVINNKKSGKSKGFGYVEFSKPEEAQAALAYSGKEIDGRAINVDISTGRSV